MIAVKSIVSRMHSAAGCLMLAWLFAVPPHASLAQTGDASPFRDYISLTTYMRSRGIDPISVDWNLIEPMCLGLRTETDQIAYNQCKYENALLNRFYGADRSRCDTASLAAYPERITRTTPIETVRVISTDGTDRTYERSANARTLRERTTLRQADYSACMHESGWNDPDDWRLGKSSR